MKKILFISMVFLLLLALTISFLFVRQFPKHELATFTASVGNPDDCKVGGSVKFLGVGSALWWYFNLPGVTESFLAEGNSFLSSGFQALICKKDQAGYEENHRRIKRLINHALKHGEDINHVGEKGFTMLHGAIIQSDVKLAEFLLANGANPSTLSDKDAVWYGVTYSRLDAEHFIKALRENNWPVDDEMVSLIMR